MHYKKEFLIALGLVGLIIVARLIPHLPNVAPVAAAALVAGVYLGRKWAIIVPLAGMALADTFLGTYEVGVMTAVYGSFVLIGGMSWWLRKNKSVLNVITVSLLSSLGFFIITNFAVWYFSDWYAYTWPGLMYAYELAVPFYRNTLIGDLVYAAVLFTVFEYFFVRKRAEKRIPITVS